MKEYLQDTFRNYVRISVDQIGPAEPIFLSDSIIQDMLYNGGKKYATWGLKENEVNQWTTDLATGRIPLDLLTIEEFEQYIKTKCSFAYNKEADRQGKKERRYHANT